MRRSSRLVVRLIVPAALVLLVGSLAALQYRWLGQVSDAERERRQTWLRQHAEELADDFDRELLRLYIALQATDGALEQRDGQAFGVQHDRWRDNARFPQMLRAIYLVGPPNGRDEVLMFDPARRTFETTPWPPSLTPVRAQLQPPPPPPLPAQPTIRGTVNGAPMALEARATFLARDMFLPSVPALVSVVASATPARSLSPEAVLNALRQARYLVAELDRDHIRSTVMPALVARHFPVNDADQYRFAVIDASRPADPIFARGIAEGTTLDPARADTVVPVFTLRADLATQVFLRPIDGPGAKAAPTIARSEQQTFTIAPPVRLPPSPPAGAGRQATGPAGARGGRVASPSGFSSNMSIVVQSSGRAERDVISYTRRAPAWQLVLQHTAGSLDAAVAQARRRNLWLSFSILGVLGAGVVLVVVNAQRSQRLAAQQMDFVATVSHELRTPLAVIRSAAQNLSAGVVTSEGQAQRYGDLIEGEGRRLTDMVEQVLEYSGLSGNRRLPMGRAVDPGSLVRAIATSCESLFDAAGITPDITIDPDLPAIVADQNAVGRAVTNLIANALKHGADGRAVSVAVRRGQSAGRDEVLVTVSDRGRGIDADDLSHIFEPFYRGRYALERQIQGNGLGLSLVRRIAEAHGGRATVVSTPGQGAAFTLHFPAVAGQPAPHAMREAAPDLSGSARG
jgi:two-component system sensor histidine kinase SenX3